MYRSLTAGFAGFVVASALAAGVASAAPAPKVTICHGTASASNPYVQILVNANSFKDGHFDGVPNKSHGVNNNPDFILEDGRICADGPGGGPPEG